MQQYLDLVSAIRTMGEDRPDRTGVGTRSLFGWQSRYDLREGFPLVTTKRVPTRSMVTELLWMLKGKTDNQWLNDNGCTIWDEWATEEQCERFNRDPGDLGPVYGAQWRQFVSVTENGMTVMFDQIERLVDDLITNPYSRRHILTGWNPYDADQVALPPCHTLSQFYVSTNGELSCQMYQRSADVFLGVPFNIASYALLTHLLAHVCGLKVGMFVHAIGDAHLYSNHEDQVELLLSRDPYPHPTLRFDGDITGVDTWTPDQIIFENYQSHPTIPAPVAV